MGVLTSGNSLRYHIRMLTNNPHIGHGKIRRCRPRLLPVAQSANRNTKPLCKLRLRKAKPCSGLADQPRSLPTVHCFLRNVKIFRVRRISRENNMLVLHLCCSFALK
jgi:hypothetical protein